MGRLSCLYPRTVEDNQGWRNIVRCNRCANCSVTRQLQWTLRLCLEQRANGLSCFVTNTYEETKRPGYLRYPDMQAFLRRLRKKTQKPVRFFSCGQYGSKYGREHWHTIFFGVSELEVSQLFGAQSLGIPGPLFQSLAAQPTELWPHGSTHIASFHVNRAKYVAKYVLRTGDDRDKENVVQMSRKPGIGLDEISRIGTYLATARPKWERVPGWWRIGAAYFPLDRLARERLVSAFEGAGGMISHKQDSRLHRDGEAAVYALCGDLLRPKAAIDIERVHARDVERTVF